MQNELYHHGIKGMRWGVRRYQYKDGSLTHQGKKKYGKNTGEILLKSAGTEAAILVGRNVTSHVLGHMGADVITTTAITRLAAAGATVVNVMNTGWSIRNNRQINSESPNPKKADRKVSKKKERKMYVNAYNNAAARMNNGLIEQFNKKYEGKDISDISSADGKKYMEDYERLWNKVFAEEYEKLS